jgi:hypothetical protein
MVSSYQKIQSFSPKYRDFTPLIPQGYHGILTTIRKNMELTPKKPDYRKDVCCSL